MKEKNDVSESRKWQELAARLRGFQTASSLSKKLGVSRRTAINYISELRKRGYLATTRGRNKVRMYEISPFRQPRHGYPGLYDIINSNSPIKLVKPYEHRVYHEMTVEEALVRAVMTRDYRTILASLALFGKVKNWPLLYRLAKKDRLQRHIGALYDTARKCVRVRRMDRRIRNRLRQAHAGERFIIPRMKSRDFRDIEREWGVFIPFNKQDLKRYGE